MEREPKFEQLPDGPSHNCRPGAFGHKRDHGHRKLVQGIDKDVQRCGERPPGHL